MSCLESQRAQACFDGELDAAESADVARHLTDCPECRALTRDLEVLRGSLRRSRPIEAPTALRLRIARALDAEDAAVKVQPAAEPMPRREPVTTATAARRWRIGAYWQGAMSGIAGSALAALLAYALLIPRTDALVDALVDAHRNSLLPDRLTMVVSSDHHTVKPWFAGRADVSPAVVDYAAQGFRLVGGRADAVTGYRAAVVVYEHGAHVINVFSWPKGPGFGPRDTERFGYHLAFWQSGDLEYCAVSDANWTELHTLVGLLRRSSEGETAEAGARRE